MMQHLAFFPILLPMLAGILLLSPLLGKNKERRRGISLLLNVATLIASVTLLLTVNNNGAQIYAIGDWSAPFGIVLVADPLSTLLVSLTTLLGLACILYASGEDDEKGNFFHPLVHFLILGVNGAFLTGDLFNLFVFFEVLLIASYALLMHGGDKNLSLIHI